MSVTLDGIAFVLDRVHTVLDSVPMYSVVNLLQELNASVSIFVAAGNDTLVNALQDSNAEIPMLVAAGNDTLVNLLQE